MANYREPQWLLPNEKNLQYPDSKATQGSGLTADRHSLYSIDFDGSNHMSTSTFSELDGLTTLSFSGWIKPTTSSTSSILSIQDNAGYEQLSIIRHSSGYLIGKIYSGTQTRRTLTASPNIAPLIDSQNFNDEDWVAAIQNIANNWSV